MRRQFISVAPHQRLADALATMRFARLRQVPVVEGDRLCGLLWYVDLVGLRRRISLEGEVGDLMRSAVFVSPEDSLERAAEVMIEHAIGALPVAEPAGAGAHMLGVLTERDLLHAAYSI